VRQPYALTLVHPKEYIAGPGRRGFLTRHCRSATLRTARESRNAWWERGQCLIRDRACHCGGRIGGGDWRS
jgi:hypothetical protein